MDQVKRYLRPDTGDIVEVLPALGGGWLVGTRKPNGAIKRLKSKGLPACKERKYCQEQLDLYVEFDKNGEWPPVKQPAEQAQAAEDLKAAKAARKKWKVGDLVRIGNGDQYDGQLGRIYCVPSARHPNWTYNVTLQDTTQEHTSVECRYDEMELVEEEEMSKTAVAKRKAKQPGEAPFDYGELVPRYVAICEKAVERIGGHQRRIASDIVAIGRELLAVKDCLEHGQFGGWLAHYFSWSQQTASRMMQAASTFKSLNLSNLTIDQSALYLLSSDKCPDEIREEVIERAEKGERITHASVKQALSNLMGDDDEPAPARRRSQPIAEDEPEDQAENLPPPSRLVPSDSWNLAEFVIAARHWINPWKDKCPEDERSELAQVLRDLAAQIELLK